MSLTITGQEAFRLRLLEGKNGEDGRGIESISFDENGYATITYTDGTTETMTQSLKGPEGVSPVVTLVRNADDNGYIMTITDAEGAHTAEIPDGQPGAPGTAGTRGADGFSPTVSVSKSGTTTTIMITDKTGEHTATIEDGATGSPGATGLTGNGIASVEQTTMRTTVTISLLLR